MRGRVRRDRLGGAAGDDLAPCVAALRARGRSIQSAVLTTSRLCSITSTVLPGVDEPLQHAEQLADVLEVQARRRLVEDVERVAGGALVQLGRRA